MSETKTRTIDVPVDDGYTVTVKGEDHHGQLEYLELVLSGSDYTEPQKVTIGELGSIEAVIRAMLSMLPADACERVVQPKPDDGRGDRTSHIVGQFVPIDALMKGAQEGLTWHPCGEAISSMATSALERLREEERLRDEQRDDDLDEAYLAEALMASIAVFSLIGYSRYVLQPDGSYIGDADNNPRTPKMIEARGHASFLMDMARERWPARKEWFEPVNELAAERKDAEA